MTIEVGGTFVDPGTVVTDDVDIGLTTWASGSVNTTMVGIYTLNYHVSDAAGNAAAAVTRSVTVTAASPPNIMLLGKTQITIYTGSTYVEPGSVVTDNVDTGLI